jgi:hypothetical protein
MHRAVDRRATPARPPTATPAYTVEDDADNERESAGFAAMSFDEALAALLALVGRPVDVHVFSAGESPYLVATFGGVLQAGYSMTGGEPSEHESIYIRIEAGSESGSISLNREVYRGAIGHEDGSLTLQLGGVEMMIGVRES